MKGKIPTEMLFWLMVGIIGLVVALVLMGGQFQNIRNLMGF